MADQQPMSLRPGRPQSSTPTPQQQQAYQYRQSYAGPQQQGPPLPGEPASSYSQVTNYSTRFPSNQYGGPNHSPTSNEMPANVFTDHSNNHSRSQSQTRSRSSTVGQNYPVAIPNQQPSRSGGPSEQQSQQPMFAQHSGHGGAQQQSAQPLFAQHSGGPSGPLPSGTSRPVSRSAAQSGPNGLGGPSSGGIQPPMPQGGGGGGLNSGPSTRPTSSRSPFTTPITAPPRQRPISILLINPNSTRSMTEACLATIRPTLPPGVELTGYTAPYPAPTAIESATDAIMSTEAVLRDLAKHAAANGETVQNHDGLLVACYSKHPLIDALRESYDVPVIGIMEGSLYVARMLGARFGIVATSNRSKILQDDAIAAYGLSHFYVGSEATHLGVLEFETRSKEEVMKRVGLASRNLVMRGADTILLGCAGMTTNEVMRAAKDAVRDEDGRRTVNVVDPIEAGVMMLVGLVGMGVPTSKKGVYKGEREGRRTRGQNWL